jgi:hypothetical protein
MLELLGLLSAILPLLGVIPYVRDILRHETKPHRGSFLIWTILGAIAFFTQFAKGATWSLFLPAGDSIATLTIFILSIRYGTGGLNKKDNAALVVAGCGLVLWYFTKQPLLTLFITIGVDAVGTVLTIVKTYHEPHTETLSSWLLAALGGLFAAGAVGKLSASLLLYPLYILLANGLVAMTIEWRRKTALLKQHA